METRDTRASLPAFSWVDLHTLRSSRLNWNTSTAIRIYAKSVQLGSFLLKDEGDFVAGFQI